MNQNINPNPTVVVGDMSFVYWSSIFNEGYNVSHGFYLHIFDRYGGFNMKFNYHYN